MATGGEKMPLHSENALVLLSGGLDSVAAMHWRNDDEETTA